MSAYFFVKFLNLRERRALISQKANVGSNQLITTHLMAIACMWLIKRYVIFIHDLMQIICIVESYVTPYYFTILLVDALRVIKNVITIVEQIEWKNCYKNKQFKSIYLFKYTFKTKTKKTTHAINKVRRKKEKL